MSRAQPVGARTAMRSSVAVIGAGVVGLTAALALQRRGHQVEVFDPLPPGRGASFGNAGFLAVELIDPLATPATLCQAPKLWLDPNGPVALPPAYWPTIAPWMTRFVAAARGPRVECGRAALAALNGASLAAWQRCLDGIDAREELVPSGYLLVWESDRGEAKAKAHADHLRRWGIAVDYLTGDAARAVEPGLNQSVRHALFFPNAHQVRDPYRLVLRLVDAFTAAGGRIRRSRVQAVSAHGNAVAVRTDTGPVTHSQALIAAGAWSRELLAGSGLSVPLEAERGYHLTLPRQSDAIRHVVGSADRRFVMTPMPCGLRVVGFTEWGGMNLPPNPRRYRSLHRHASALLTDSSILDDDVGRWMGFRPTLPDSLPVIDRHPEYSNIHFAFGHQHLGLTQAAITAELVAASMSGKTPALDMGPFRVTRFR